MVAKYILTWFGVFLLTAYLTCTVGCRLERSTYTDTSLEEIVQAQKDFVTSLRIFEAD
jgi:hypothetical protein